jgi:hypothetical protein
MSLRSPLARFGRLPPEGQGRKTSPGGFRESRRYLPLDVPMLWPFSLKKFVVLPRRSARPVTLSFEKVVVSPRVVAWPVICPRVL